MPYQSQAPLFHSIMQAAPLAGNKSHFSTGSPRNLPLSSSTSAAAAPNAGFLRRLAATPRGRASLAAAVVVGCVIDYELWTLYGAKYFDEWDADHMSEVGRARESWL
ncbi:hypothetical protein GGR55DRAFT_677953 [Xylaria sp. FL0064]|nr:hypothetical protein GGR55DRAFT_677953 [Xylaria sp. FL0064]